MREINLLDRSDPDGGKRASAEGVIRRIAWLSLAALFVSGIVTAGLFLFTRNAVVTLEGIKIQMLRDIQAQSVKEGLLLSLKERTAVASRALDAAKPWGKLFSILGGVAPGISFSSIAVNETGQVNASLELSTLDETFVVASHVMTLSAERKIRSPQMQSFTIREDGSIQLTLLFHPIL